MTRILEHDHEHGFATRSVHAGQIIEPLAGAVMTPIYQTSTYVQEGLGKNRGYEYARTQNPTREALERNVASLEGATHGFTPCTRCEKAPGQYGNSVNVRLHREMDQRSVLTCARTARLCRKEASWDRR